MLKSLLKLLSSPEPPYSVLKAPEVPTVTEEYRLPAEAVGEYYRLLDAYMAAPDNESTHAKWKLWSHIARNVPAVADNPDAAWTVDRVSTFSIKVWRKYPVNMSQPFSVVETRD
jgi:hypothetical protein